MYDFVTEERIEQIYQVCNCLLAQITVVALRQKIRQRFQRAHIFRGDIPSHGKGEIKLQRYRISLAVLSSVGSGDVGKQFAAFFQRFYDVVQILQKSLSGICVHVQVIHHQNIRCIVAKKTGIQRLIDGVIIRRIGGIQGEFAFDLDHHLGMELMVHCRRLLEQRVFIERIHLQHLGHL